MKAIDPERYGSLEHPGDAFSYDIYTQVARALRDGQAFGDLEPSSLVASGQSQSAAAMVSYINGVQPLTQAFDGFFLHSRGGSGLPFPPVGETVDLTSTLGGTATVLRSDTAVPIVDVQAENDLYGVLGSAPARQPDSDTFRLWEVAGTAHADRTLVGDATADLVDCGVPINDAPMHVVVRAAMRHLVTWVLDGEPPPEASRLESTEADPPDDPTRRGRHRPRWRPHASRRRARRGAQRRAGPWHRHDLLAVGLDEPLPAARLAELYPSVEDYERAYDDAVEDAITAGFVLEDDRAAIESYAEPDLVAP